MAANPLRVGIVMDPIESITPYKDSSLAMLLEAERRGAEIHYFNQSDLKIVSGAAMGRSRRLSVEDDRSRWWRFGDEQEIGLGELDVILMRKDPPFDMEYIYTTYILDRAKEAGALIMNDPQALRNMNEKAFTAWFPDFAPETLISRSMDIRINRPMTSSTICGIFSPDTGTWSSSRWKAWAANPYSSSSRATRTPTLCWKH